MADDSLSALKKASQGLTYESETDAAWEAFAWKQAEGVPAKAKLLQLGGHGKGEPVEQMSLDEFFGDLVKEQGWHGKAEQETARKYRALLSVIRERLGGAKVFKVGDGPQKTVYVVGKTKEGGWAGLKTNAVET